MAGTSTPSNLAVRLLTVALLGPLLLLLLFAGPVWGWALLLVVTAVIASREFLAMTHRDDPSSAWIGALLTGALCASVYVGTRDARVLVSGVAAALVGLVVLPLVRLGNIETAALRLWSGVGTATYVGFGMASLALLRRDTQPDGARWVFLTLTIAWMGDTGGYTLGRLAGKTKLYEAVSPKKTWEGLFGSVLFATGSAVGASLTYLPSLSLLHALGLGVFGALLGQTGDLAESLVKRSTGVKDSGALLPGHGGLLDRIDALLVVSALVYVHSLWFV